MKIKVKKEVETEVDVTFPFYLKYGFSLHKVLSEDSFITVRSDRYVSAIDIHNKCGSTVALFLDKNEPCTEEEFNDTYEKALQQLQTAGELQTLKIAG